tara:strand:- start:3775 stop:4725 length:951 start_codon:yes stop_codon:yes gene_type:complete
MRRFYIFFIFFTGIYSLSSAQQNPYFSTYYVNPGIVNSSLNSYNNKNSVSFVYRNQWSNYTPSNLSSSGKAPSTGILSLNLNNREKSFSYGFNLISDNLGPKETFILSPYLSYRKKIKNSYVSLSMSPNYKAATMDFNSLVFVDPSDPFNLALKDTQSRPDLSVGISYFSNLLLLSIGLENLTQPSFDFGINDLVNKDLISYSIIAKYNIELNRYTKLEPFVLIRSDLKAYTFDISGVITHQDRMNFGLSYRFNEALVGFLGYSFLKTRKLYVGYSFDYVVHNVNAKAPTSHELVIRYDLPTPQLKKPIRTPRFIY